MKNFSGRALVLTVGLLLALSAACLLLAMRIPQRTVIERVIYPQAPSSTGATVAAELPPKTSVDERDLVTSTCWDEGGDYCQIAWEKQYYQSSSRSWKTIRYRLGNPDANGDVRFLYARNASDTVMRVGQLPLSLTYTATFSDMDGSAMNVSPDVLTQEGNSSFRIEAYPAYPIGFSDYRLPAVVKYINPPEELFR